LHTDAFYTQVSADLAYVGSQLNNTSQVEAFLAEQLPRLSALYRELKNALTDYGAGLGNKWTEVEMGSAEGSDSEIRNECAIEVAPLALDLPTSEAAISVNPPASAQGPSCLRMSHWLHLSPDRFSSFRRLRYIAHTHSPRAESKSGSL